MNDIVFIDFETTGFPAVKAKPLEVYMMRCRTEVCFPIMNFQMIVNPCMIIPKKAQDVNKIKQSWVDLADGEDLMLKDLNSLIREDDILCGHNIDRYDIMFLRRKSYKFPNKTMDTLDMAKKLGFKKGCLKQHELYYHFYPEEKKKDEELEKQGKQVGHRADVDVKRLRKVYLRLAEMQGAGKLF